MESVRAFSGAALARLRQDRGLSHDALAELVGILRPNLIAYEKGRRLPSPATLSTIAAALGVAPADLALVPRSDWTLADLRAFAGLSKTEVAEALGVARSTYDAYETGRRQLLEAYIPPLARMLGSDESEIRTALLRTTR